METVHSWCDKIDDIFLRVASEIKLKHTIVVVVFPKEKETDWCREKCNVGEVGVATGEGIADLSAKSYSWLVEHAQQQDNQAINKSISQEIKEAKDNYPTKKS